MKKLFIVFAILAALAMVSCTNGNGAKRLLESQGYEHVTITGYRWFGCGEGDWYHTGFEAVGPKGDIVSGVVCEGLFFKGATPRFD